MKQLLLLFLFFTVSRVRAFEVPAFSPNIVDKSGVLSPAELAQLNQKISVLQTQSHIFAAILIVNSTQPETIEQASEQTFKKWNLGQKGVDNGLLMIVAIVDHRMRIEVGYGLEGSIPDIRAKQIISDILMPNFKKKSYAEGFNSALDACNALVLHGNPIQLKEKGFYNSIIVRLFFIWFLMIVFIPILMRIFLVRRAQSFVQELRPTNEEASLVRIIFVSGKSVCLTIFLLINPGVFFIILLSKQQYFGVLFLLFAYLFLFVENKGYWAFRTPEVRADFLERSRKLVSGATIEAFDSLPSGGSGGFEGGDSSSGSSSSDGGSSGGGGASGSW